MNNNTETIEQAIHTEKIVKNLLGVPDKHLNNEDNDKIDFGIRCINFQKEQDEAKYKTLSVNELLIKREKIESLILAQDKMALVNYELKQLNIDEHPKSYLTDLEAKYKALLDSHNELLEALFYAKPLVQPAVYCSGKEFIDFKDRIDILINKAKNI